MPSSRNVKGSQLSLRREKGKLLPPMVDEARMKKRSQFLLHRDYKMRNLGDNCKDPESWTKDGEVIGFIWSDFVKQSSLAILRPGDYAYVIIWRNL